MGQLLITLDDDLHRALEEASARQGRSISELIGESLRLSGIKPVEDVTVLVDRSRSRAELSEPEALEIAENEVREARQARRTP